MVGFKGLEMTRSINTQTSYGTTSDGSVVLFVPKFQQTKCGKWHLEIESNLWMRFSTICAGLTGV